ncbi:hypothetical protein A7P25_03245 [Achromobacter xylosoxidans]|nr:hypothetical protein A7P25_03245 [Achromobacter xylosoxidans]
MLLIHCTKALDMFLKITFCFQQQLLIISLLEKEKQAIKRLKKRLKLPMYIETSSILQMAIKQ